MKVSVAANEQAHLLYALGVSFHDYGAIKRGRQITARYFKASRLTDDQRRKVQEAAPEAYFCAAGPAYAPEIRHALVCFPTQAELNRTVAK